MKKNDSKPEETSGQLPDAEADEPETATARSRKNGIWAPKNLTLLAAVGLLSIAVFAQRSCTQPPATTPVGELVKLEQWTDTLAEPADVPQSKDVGTESLAKPRAHFGKSIIWREQLYNCSFVNPQSPELAIDFLWKDKNGTLLDGFERCIAQLKKSGKDPLMLVNAGIFDPNQAPLGLFYSNGKKLRKFNSDKGEGNFFLEPNGAFIIEKSGNALVKTKEAYLSTLADTSDILHATQSGPMLVIKNEINKAFNPESKNLHIRHGVGVQKDGTVVFAISKEKVTLHEFAAFFCDRLTCPDALYLDGAISAMYLPEIGLKQISGGFAGIIAISRIKN